MGTKQPTKEMVIKNSKTTMNLGWEGQNRQQCITWRQWKKWEKEEQQSQWEDRQNQKSNNQTNLQLELKKCKNFLKKDASQHFWKAPKTHQMIGTVFRWGPRGGNNQPLKLFYEKITVTIDQHCPCWPWGQKRSNFVSEKLKLRTTINSRQSA